MKQRCWCVSGREVTRSGLQWQPFGWVHESNPLALINGGREPEKQGGGCCKVILGEGGELLKV